MKNVIVFQEFIHHTDGRHDWEKEELFNYFRAQIDNSLYWGWKPEDIIILANFAKASPLTNLVLIVVIKPSSWSGYLSYV